MAVWKKTRDTDTYQTTLMLNGAVFNLTTGGAESAELVLTNKASGARTVIAMTLTTPASGLVSATLPPTLEAGQYNVEIVVTFDNGVLQTWPDRGYDQLAVQSSL